MGEFGGHGYPVQGHLWDANRRNWGYGGLAKEQSRIQGTLRHVARRCSTSFAAKGIAAGVYTQTTDVEGEINGLMTYDRKVIKIPAKELAELHRCLFEIRTPRVTREIRGAAAHGERAEKVVGQALQPAKSTL